eukprot:6189786-Pleurochrysis_carterae.AAC.2
MPAFASTLLSGTPMQPLHSSRAHLQAGARFATWAAFKASPCDQDACPGAARLRTGPAPSRLELAAGRAADALLPARLDARALPLASAAAPSAAAFPRAIAEPDAAAHAAAACALAVADALVGPVRPAEPCPLPERSRQPADDACPDGALPAAAQARGAAEPPAQPA